MTRPTRRVPNQPTASRLRLESSPGGSESLDSRRESAHLITAAAGLTAIASLAGRAYLPTEDCGGTTTLSPNVVAAVMRPCQPCRPGPRLSLTGLARRIYGFHLAIMRTERKFSMGTLPVDRVGKESCGMGASRFWFIRGVFVRL